MNERERLIHRRDVRARFKLGTPLNAVRINANNTVQHEMWKFLVCYSLARAGKEFMTECQFSNGRADIVNVSDAEIVEVLKTETEKELFEKAFRYPLPIRYIRADQPCRVLTIDQLNELPYLEVKNRG